VEEKGFEASAYEQGLGHGSEESENELHWDNRHPRDHNLEAIH